MSTVQLFTYHFCSKFIAASIKAFVSIYMKIISFCSISQWNAKWKGCFGKSTFKGMLRKVVVYILYYILLMKQKRMIYGSQSYNSVSLRYRLVIKNGICHKKWSANESEADHVILVHWHVLNYQWNLLSPWNFWGFHSYAWWEFAFYFWSKICFVSPTHCTLTKVFPCFGRCPLFAASIQYGRAIIEKQ